MRVVDITGKRFGRLIAIERVDREARDKHTCAMWRCRCDCGRVLSVRGGHLRSGYMQSCGCLRLDTHRTHGDCHSVEYQTWANMLDRCRARTGKAYRNYGSRGISVCERWLEYENFLADVGRRPSPKHSIDRFPDLNGPYEPGNVRWATWSQQARNRRTNRLLTYDGRTMCLTDWAEAVGLHQGCLRWRLVRGWSVERALTTPSKQ